VCGEHLDGWPQGKAAFLLPTNMRPMRVLFLVTYSVYHSPWPRGDIGSFRPLVIQGTTWLYNFYIFPTCCIITRYLPFSNTFLLFLTTKFPFSSTLQLLLHYWHNHHYNPNYHCHPTHHTSDYNPVINGNDYSCVCEI
jgi:hypothetical protein